MMDYSDLIGIPFDEKNINGVNCYELLRRSYKKHGIILPKTNISVLACTSISNQEIQDNIIKHWEPIKIPEYPCGILILSTNPSYANHIGFYVGNGKMLHISINTNSVIERMYPRYRNKILGFYRFKG